MAFPLSPDQLSVSTIRLLAVEAVQAANSGHSGLSLGGPSVACVLFSRLLRFNPQGPKWPNRRSAGQPSPPVPNPLTNRVPCLTTSYHATSRRP